MKAIVPDHRGKRVVRANETDIREAGLKPKQFGLPEHFAYDGPERWYALRGHHWSYTLYMASFMVIVVTSHVIAHRMGWTAWWGALAVGTAISPVIGFITLFFMRIWHRSVTDRYERELLAHHRCPHCLYTISGLTIQPDGCTVCPECNAAWRLPNNREQQQGVSNA